MKFILVVFTLINVVHYAVAQVPQSINYQAGVYNASGTPIINRNLQLRTSILDTSASGNLLYSEIFNTVTDMNGLFSVELGAGSILSGNFAIIDWSNGNKWLKTEIDTGTGFIMMGSTKFLSVPFALYADNAANKLTGFGEWTSTFSSNTIYKAQTDGFISVNISGSVMEFGCIPASIHSDSTGTPSTIVSRAYNGAGFLLAPIRKNDYWRVATGNCSNSFPITIKWLPVK